MKNQDQVYYIEPIGGQTNCQIFQDVFKSRDEDICEGKMCFDGTPRNLLRVDLKDLAICLINQKRSKLSFNVFRQTENGIERLFISFEDQIEAALKGKTSFSEVGITHEEIEQAVSVMPLVPPKRKKHSPLGVFPMNANKCIRKIIPTRARRNNL